MKSKRFIENRAALLIVAAITCFLVSGCLSSGSDEENDLSDPSSGGAAAQPNRPPVISGQPPIDAQAGDSYYFKPDASDPDGDSLTFKITNQPHWLAFDSATGLISGSPTLADQGSYENIVISVSDGTETTALPTFNISVVATGNKSITLSWAPPETNTDGSLLTDLIAYKVYYGIEYANYPNEIYINNPGVITYVIDNLLPRKYYFVATAINSAGQESDFSNVAVKEAT